MHADKTMHERPAVSRDAPSSTIHAVCRAEYADKTQLFHGFPSAALTT